MVNTTLAVSVQVRARTFYAEATGTPVEDCEIPVVGGHAGMGAFVWHGMASPCLEKVCCRLGQPAHC